MASSVSPSCNSELPIASLGKAAEAALPPQPARLPISQQPSAAPETLEQSFSSLDLDPLSDLRTTTRTKKSKGPVRLRLARFGRKNAPFYRIHAADSRCRRDGKFLERIGYYDPRRGKDGQKRIALNFERAKYWLSVGAQPTDTVRRLFSIAGLLPEPSTPQITWKDKNSTKNEDAGMVDIFDEEFDSEADLGDSS